MLPISWAQISFALEGHPIDSHNHHRACGSVLHDFHLEIKSMATVELCMHAQIELVFDTFPSCLYM
jgi:hypothetical protein